MQITNTSGLPQPLVDAVRNDGYSPGSADASVTELLSPPQQAALRRKHEDALTEDAADRIYALLGQTMASVLERANTEGMAEKRLYIELDGWTISGQFDRMAMLRDSSGWNLQDYKLCSVWEIIHGLKAEREQQLNCYAELARQNGYPISRLEIVAILRDWSKPKALREPDYPTQQVQVVRVPLWSSDQARAFLSQRIALHKQARAGNLPACTPEEKWQRPTVWAVMKQGRKSAMPGGLKARASEAAMMASTVPGGYVEERPGECTRCELYCPVNRFCDQYRRESHAQQQAAVG